MNAEQLWDTTMDQKENITKKNYDESQASEIDLTFTTLMGKKLNQEENLLKKMLSMLAI